MDLRQPWRGTMSMTSTDGRKSKRKEKASMTNTSDSPPTITPPAITPELRAKYEEGSRLLIDTAHQRDRAIVERDAAILERNDMLIEMQGLRKQVEALMEMVKLSEDNTASKTRQYQIERDKAVVEKADLQASLNVIAEVVLSQLKSSAVKIADDNMIVDKPYKDWDTVMREGPRV